MKSILLKSFWGLGLLLLSGNLISCGLATSSGSAGTPGITGSGTVQQFWVGVKQPQTTDINPPRYTPIKSQWGTNGVNSDWATNNLSAGSAVSCIADPAGSAADKDILCLIHADELDLMDLGITIVANASKDICEYMVYQPTYYWNQKPGNGPNAVTLVKDANGNVYPGAGPCNGHSTSIPAGASLDSTNNLVCDYDYTRQYVGGQNCCEGQYSLTVYQETAAPIDCTKETATGPTVTMWGGRWGNCVDGSGKFAWNKFDQTHSLPVGDITHVEADNVQKTQIIPIPPPGFVPNESFQTANFFEAQAAGGTNSAPRDQRVVANWSAYNVYNDAGTGAGFAEPFIDVLCLDRDEEVNARIRVMIRKWNTKAQFTSFLGGTVVDPDQYDDYTTFFEPAPFNNLPYNDKPDMDDFKVNWGTRFTTFPNIWATGGVGGLSLRSFSSLELLKPPSTMGASTKSSGPIYIDSPYDVSKERVYVDADTNEVVLHGPLKWHGTPPDEP